MKAERIDGASREPGGAGAGSSEVFSSHRPLPFFIAYGMLGRVMDTEDVVQEVFVLWQRVAKAEVRWPKAYLSTTTTRLCNDQLRSARTRREEYVGPWLPEPLLAERGEPSFVDDAVRLTSRSRAAGYCLSRSQARRCAFRAGGLTCPDEAYGELRWEEFQRSRVTSETGKG